MTQQRSPELVEALSALIGQQPFFAVLAFNLLEIHECETLPNGITALPTAATDGRGLYFNPKFMKTLTVPERIFVIAHEITHVIMQHPQRMKLYRDLGFGPDMNPWNQMKFNQAADYVINSYLNDMKVGRQPLNTLLNGQYGKDDLVDDVYCKLPDPPEDDGQGNGNGPGGWDTHMEGAADGSGSDTTPGKAEIQRAVKMGEAAAKAMGKMPAGLKRLIDEICEPQVSWKDILERKIMTLYGNDETSWARVNRRRLAVSPHIPWPGRMGLKSGPIAIEIDTSGSIGDKELNVFLGEVKGVLEGARPEKIYAMYVDSQLFNDEVVELDDPSDLGTLKQKAGGGGGTDMTVVFREVEQRQLDVDYVIVLTDGHTPFGDDCGIPTIWCITTPDIVAPWGDSVHVKLG